MVGRPAARVFDPVAHPLPPVLTPGPGSFNVIIGYLPAWRGVPAAAATALKSAKASSNATLAAAKAATTAAAGTPGAPAAIAAEETAKAAAIVTMSASITAAAGGADIHICSTPLPLPPHGPGVVIDGSPTVLINGLPACRQMDTILEALGPPNKIVTGLASVLIGNGSSIILEGTEAEQMQLAQLIEDIRNSGPKGKAFIESLENSPSRTRISIGTWTRDKDGVTTRLPRVGGGYTTPAASSVSGDNEVMIDPTNLVDYKTTSGGTAKETPQGLLVHELGHAKLYGEGDPSQSAPGSAPEDAVRKKTNGIRAELGLPGDAGQ